jgi:hypothetical protein
MNGIAWVITKTSSSIKGVQSGQLQTYGFVFVTGSIALALLLLYLWV